MTVKNHAVSIPVVPASLDAKDAQLPLTKSTLKGP
jgi:hypothetical protein